MTGAVRPLLNSGNALKLAVFGANCSSGRSYITIPDRWEASWDNNLRLAQLAEELGLEAMIPVARWRGYGGETNPNGSSFEATSWACGLLASTRRLSVFSTIHVPLISPVLAAKQMATADQIGHGRFGLNIVCGWSADEFAMFGVPKREHDDGYAQAEEWWQIINRIWAGEAPFDFEGHYYQLRGVHGAPGPYGGGTPPVMNAGTSPVGRAFAARYADMHFDSVGSAAATMERVQQTKQQARSHGRSIQVWTPVGVVCRPTRREALEFLEYCAANMDWDAVGIVAARQDTNPVAQHTLLGSMRTNGVVPTGERPQAWLALGRGSYCVVGDPDDVTAEIQQLHALGLDGLALNFVHYLRELPYFAEEVLPRLERLGLRHAGATTSPSATLAP